MSIFLARKTESLPKVRVPVPDECTDGLVIDFARRGRDRSPGLHETARLRLDLTRPGDSVARTFASWIEGQPMAWLFLCGSVCAPVLDLLGQRLDLRIGGAIVVAPDDWVRRGRRTALPLAPLAFPALLVRKGPAGCLAERAARDLAQAWGARMIDALPSGNPFDTAEVRDLVLRRHATISKARDRSLSARLH